MTTLVHLNKFTLVAIFISITLLLSQAAPAAISNNAAAVDMAGHQRMLSQRMFKDYCLIVLNVKAEKYEQELTDSIQLFQKQLDELMNFANTEHKRQAFEEVNSVWVDLKPLLMLSPTRSNVEEIKERTDSLLRRSHAATQVLSHSEAGSRLRIVDVSGRQRMLSQRMANRYMMKALGFEDRSYRSDLEIAAKEFKTALKELTSSQLNSVDIEKKLKKVKTQYSLFEFSIGKKEGNTFPFIIADAAEKILINMNNVTGLYVDELSR